MKRPFIIGALLCLALVDMYFVPNRLHESLPASLIAGSTAYTLYELKVDRFRTTYNALCMNVSTALRETQQVLSHDDWNNSLKEFDDLLEEYRLLLEIARDALQENEFVRIDELERKHFALKLAIKMKLNKLLIRDHTLKAA